MNIILFLSNLMYVFFIYFFIFLSASNRLLLYNILNVSHLHSLMRRLKKKKTIFSRDNINYKVQNKTTFFSCIGWYSNDILLRLYYYYYNLLWWYYIIIIIIIRFNSTHGGEHNGIWVFDSLNLMPRWYMSLVLQCPTIYYVHRCSGDVLRVTVRRVPLAAASSVFIFYTI